MINLRMEGGKEDGEAGYVTQRRLLLKMELMLRLQEQKASGYGEAWRDQGWLGNVARVLSKASRLKNMLWREDPINQVEESIEDTLMDLALLCLFTMINHDDRNKWGDHR